MVQESLPVSVFTSVHTLLSNQPQVVLAMVIDNLESPSSNMPSGAIVMPGGSSIAAAVNIAATEQRADSNFFINTPFCLQLIRSEFHDPMSIFYKEITENTTCVATESI